MPGDTATYDGRIRNWDEEWVSELLEEALRLKKKSAKESRRASCRT